MDKLRDAQHFKYHIILNLALLSHIQITIIIILHGNNFFTWIYLLKKTIAQL